MAPSHFDQIAELYDETLPAHVIEHYTARRAAFALRAAPPRGRVLDVGCGTGVLAQRLAGAGCRVTGVDPSAGMLERLRERAPLVEAVQASGTALPFEESSFDLALTVAALHHIASPPEVAATLAEMVRVVRPRGRVIVWDHNPRNPYWRRLMARVPQDTGEERLIPEAEVLGGLCRAGARIISVQQLGWVPDFTPPSLLGAVARAEAVMERVPAIRRLGAHNVVVAEPA